MIKKKFLIWFKNYENSMSTEISISESVFKEQLRFLREQVRLTKDDEIPVEELGVRVTETSATVETEYNFRSGLADVYLTKVEAKEGYRLLTKSEMKKKGRRR